MFPRDLNKIDDLMQEITEQQDIAQEISEAFSQRVGFGDDFDEVGDAVSRMEHVAAERDSSSWDFPGGPLVTASHPSAGAVGSIPGWRAKIPLLQRQKP